MVALLAVSSLIFLGNFNLVLQRLSAMLPDETLRLETKHFTALNRYLLLTTVALGIVYCGLIQFHYLPPALAEVLIWLERGGTGLLIFLVLLPLAMTMALLWKIKETILDSVFGAEH